MWNIDIAIMFSKFSTNSHSISFSNILRGNIRIPNNRNVAFLANIIFRFLISYLFPPEYIWYLHITLFCLRNLCIYDWSYNFSICVAVCSAVIIDTSIFMVFRLSYFEIPFLTVPVVSRPFSGNFFENGKEVGDIWKSYRFSYSGAFPRGIF